MPKIKLILILIKEFHTFQELHVNRVKEFSLHRLKIIPKYAYEHQNIVN